MVAPDRTDEQDSTGADGRIVHLPEPEPPESAGRTLWSRRDTPLRRFLSTEAGGAVFLLGAAVAALVWANIDLSFYTQVWGTELSVVLGHFVLSMDLRTWVNSGLMSFFFLVVGLEARREFDIGEFRERTRAVLPVLAGVGGMTAAIGLYLAINAGRPSAQGWGVAMSTDTAFALGLLALLGHRVPERLRAFVLTVTVVDDIVGVVVIATAYTRSVDVVPLLVAAGLFAAVLVAVRSARPLRVGVLRPGRRRLGSHVEVRGRPGRGRARRRPGGLRRPGGPPGPRARLQLVHRVP